MSCQAARGLACLRMGADLILPASVQVLGAGSAAPFERCCPAPTWHACMGKSIISHGISVQPCKALDAYLSWDLNLNRQAGSGRCVQQHNRVNCKATR